ncbi:MAG: NAD(P)/FAD-dependent oxidoreductase [Aphanocapsa sp. GSE-SYN-MK-11-07L]|jgi:NADH dehydrogenase|nr:NAD(P)/FAD-dependent oxidoreductase [Aphanocapsa sp. GSE-SYN-MK-11-07L]
MTASALTRLLTDSTDSSIGQPTEQICILGGGFGGLYTALRLSQLPWLTAQKPQIVLVDQSDRFLFLPLLYELVTGELQTWEIAPPFEELLAETGIRFVQASVSQIDLSQRQVELGNGQTLNYDRLVLALGGETPLDQVPGAAEHALTFRAITDAYRLEEKLRALEESTAEKIRIVVVGAGPSGVELACKLGDRLGQRGRIRLVDRNDQILQASPPFNQTAAKTALEQREIWIDLETIPVELAAGKIWLEYKSQVDEIPVDIVLWTVGTAIAPAIRQLPLAHNERGQLTTTTTLQLIDHPEIFALGDLADCRDAEGQQVPSTAQAAFQQADYVGWNLWAGLTDRPLLPFQYSHLGEMLTLGVDSAALSGLGIKLDGPLASLVRRLAYLYRMPTLEHQLKVGFNWILRPFLASIPR